MREKINKLTGYVRRIVAGIPLFRQSLVLLVIASAVSFYLPSTHDYPQYIYQWSLFLETGHPWIDYHGNFNGNAYGPLFSLFAIPYGIHPCFPKFIFTLSWFALSFFILWFARQRKLPQQKIRLLWAALLLNPFFWILIPWLGSNEIIVTLFLVAALFAFQKREQHLAGVLIGLGALYKFEPMFVVPFLFVSRNRLRGGFLAAFLMTFLAGYFLSWILWKDESLIPIDYALNRSAKFLSIFSFLKEEYSPLAGPFVQDIDSLSIPILIIVLAAFFILQLYIRMESITATIVALTVTYLFYKVNHPQFHINLMILFPLWYATKHERILRHRISVLFPLIYFCFMIILEIMHVSEGLQGRMYFVYEFIGLPAFVISLLSLYTFVRFGIKDMRNNEMINP